MPTYNYSYGNGGGSFGVPSFQDVMGQSPNDLIGFLNSQRMRRGEQEFGFQRNLQNDRLAAERDLVGMGHRSARELAELGYQSHEGDRDLQRDLARAENALVREQDANKYQYLDRAARRPFLDELMAGALADVRNRRANASAATRYRESGGGIGKPLSASPRRF